MPQNDAPEQAFLGTPGVPGMYVQCLAMYTTGQWYSRGIMLFYPRLGTFVSVARCHWRE